ncbi:MAG: endolytic transglycosylase MltG [Clostridiales bacterium]|nr:endolytic transglycosylase MltG [Clostridiales bacterium]
MNSMKKYLFKTANILGFMVGYALNAVILLVCAYAVYYAATNAFSAGEEFTRNSDAEKEFAEVTVEIENETSLADMAQILEEKGLVYNAYIYQFENFLKGYRDPYNAGTYTLNTQMDTTEINSTLREVIVPSTDRKITIQEGRSVKEIAAYLESEGIVKAEDFIQTCEHGDFKYDFLRDVPYRTNRLEGYLFPDTYFVSEHATSSEIIDKMLYRFQQMYDAESATRAMELGLSMDETIIIASIIEKEIKREEERALASSVIFNRLNTDMKLQMCSTILYVLEKRKERLLDEDLEIESPYNTYKNAGLPIGPIGNPGKACIDAALNPQETDYLYFVVKNEETGEHVFTADYNEFTDAKVLYNQKY